MVDFTRGLIASPDPADTRELWRLPLRKLHRSPIAPIEAAGLLKDKQRLIIVPHAELHYLPFAALLSDGPRETFLVERFEVVYAPSVSLWVRFGERRFHGTEAAPSYRIAYDHGELAPLGVVEVRMVNGTPTGGTPRTFVPDGRLPAWAPDGQEIAYIRSDTAVWVVEADGSGAHQVAARDTVAIFTRVTWSGDGQRLAWIEDAEDYSGNPARTITAAIRSAPGSTSWSPPTPCTWSAARPVDSAASAGPTAGQSAFRLRRHPQGGDASRLRRARCGHVGPRGQAGVVAGQSRDPVRGPWGHAQARGPLADDRCYNRHHEQERW